MRPRNRKHVLTMNAVFARLAGKTVYTRIPTWKRLKFAKITRLDSAQGDLSALMLT